MIHQFKSLIKEKILIELIPGSEMWIFPSLLLCDIILAVFGLGQSICRYSYMAASFKKQSPETNMYMWLWWLTTQFAHFPLGMLPIHRWTRCLAHKPLVFWGRSSR